MPTSLPTSPTLPGGYTPLPGTAPLQELSDIGDPRYNFSSLIYPLDLGHEAFNGHYINFYINVHTSTQYLEGNQYNYTPAPGASGGSYKVIDDPRRPPGGNKAMGGSMNNLMQKRINQAISLYMPDSMGFQHQLQWGAESLMDFGKMLMKTVANARDAATTKAGADNARAYGSAARTVGSVANDTFGGLAQMAGRGLGYMINPQLLVLFRGIDMRHFQFDFVFTPRDPQEAANIRNIIKAFRFHAAPEIRTDLEIYYVAPSTFDIELCYKNKENLNITKISTCVLTNYSVDYSPYGWSCYAGGMPVQTTLSLLFMETSIIDKKMVEKGY
jgi:hypothetical protein